MTIGIICEYNPLHNGHIYHINKIKEMYPNSNIILVMSGNYTQRGIVSIIDKWKKTEIALNYVDLVVELPFVFCIRAADIFAGAAIDMLKNLNVDKIVFGTETLNPEKLKKIALCQKNKKFDKLVKNYLNEGFNYPTSLSKAVYDLTNISVKNSNDLLGISYVKELIDTDIEPITIKRNGNYLSNDLKNISSSSIRKALKENKSVKKYVPEITVKYLKNLHFNDQYFNLLKYKIISEINNLNIYLNVDEGIENRIKKYIYTSNCLDEFINNIKTKRFTFNKINRMLICILCGFTKEDAKKYQRPSYIRVLGFNKNGRKLLKNINCKLPIITNFTKYEELEFELKSSYIYYNKKDKTETLEYKCKPIIK